MAAFISRAFQRYISKSAVLADVKHSASAGAHGPNPELWGKLFYFVGLPAVGLGMVNAYIGHQNDHGKPRPEFKPYEHMRIRTKRLPWGDGNHSLFHNPEKNALPDGYETEDPHHH